jgi:phosphoribosylformylglycinamidine (FGAM) synthase-like amidotransferase family enzyme
VVGIMPHPERAADPALGRDEGRGFFTSMAAWQTQPFTAKVLNR